MTHLLPPALPKVSFSLLICVWPAAIYADSGQLVTATELRATAEAASPPIAQLPVGTPVEVGARQGAFYKVKTATQEGYVRMLSVRLTSVVRTAEPAPSGVIALSQAPRSSTTVATGIRGLSRTDIERAEENPAAVAQLEMYRVSIEEARQFGAALTVQTQPSVAPAVAPAVGR